VRGFAQVLLRQIQRSGAPDPARLRQGLAQIERQSVRLANLVNELLDLSRLDAGMLTLAKQPTEVTALVAEVVTAFREMHPQREFVLDATPEAAAVVDAPRLEQVVTNVLDNAVKFSPPSAPIEVGVGLVGASAVQIVVRDRGKGIPAEQRDRIFERHYQVADGELHGGAITMESPADGGTCFVVSLPG
jgi:signal transduction histidine kinase